MGLNTILVHLHGFYIPYLWKPNVERSPNCLRSTPVTPRRWSEQAAHKQLRRELQGDARIPDSDCKGLRVSSCAWRVRMTQYVGLSCLELGLLYELQGAISVLAKPLCDSQRRAVWNASCGRSFPAYVGLHLRLQQPQCLGVGSPFICIHIFWEGR